MNWHDTYWAGLKSVIAATWPEIRPGQVILDTQIERRDWINELNKGDLSNAYVVVKLEYTPTTDWPASWTAYEVAATIHYIAPTKLPAGTDAKTIAGYLTGRLIALSQALLAAPAAVGTVLNSFPLATNADDPVNISLLEAKLAYQAGSLQVTSIVVDSGSS